MSNSDSLVCGSFLCVICGRYDDTLFMDVFLTPLIGRMPLMFGTVFSLKMSTDQPQCGSLTRKTTVRSLDKRTSTSHRSGCLFYPSVSKLPTVGGSS